MKGGRKGSIGRDGNRVGKMARGGIGWKGMGGEVRLVSHNIFSPHKHFSVSFSIELVNELLQTSLIDGFRLNAGIPSSNPHARHKAYISLSNRAQRSLTLSANHKRQAPAAPPTLCEYQRLVSIRQWHS